MKECLDYIIIDCYLSYYLDNNDLLNKENIIELLEINEITKEEFFKQIERKEFIKYLYQYIKDTFIYDEIDIDSMFAYLILNFIYNNYNDDTINNIIKENPNTLIKEFLTNDKFGFIIIKEYIYNYNNQQNERKIKKELIKKGYKEDLDKWTNMTINIYSLNRIVKDKLVIIYYELEDEIENKDEIYEIIVNTIYSVEDEIYDDNMDFIYTHKIYILKLIYSYLYNEISCNENIINNKKVINYIKEVIEEKQNLIPDNKELLVEIIKIFFDLIEKYKDFNIYFTNSIESPTIKKLTKFNKEIALDALDL